MRSFPLDDVWNAAEDAQLWTSMRSTGVLKLEDNLDTLPAGGMRVKVTRGLGWLNWAWSKGIAFANDDDFYINIAIADGVQPRIDRIVVRYNQTTTPHEVYATVLQGFPQTFVENSRQFPCIESFFLRDIFNRRNALKTATSEQQNSSAISFK